MDVHPVSTLRVDRLTESGTQPAPREIWQSVGPDRSDAVGQIERDVFAEEGESGTQRVLADAVVRLREARELVQNREVVEVEEPSLVGCLFAETAGT